MMNETPHTEAIERARTRHAGAPIDFQTESHTHPEKGCRCLSCHITTGCMISTGIMCDETSAYVDTADYPDNCLTEVLTWSQATALVEAYRDGPVLLAEIDRLTRLLAEADDE